MPLQATSGAASYDAFGGGVAAVPNYIEDVFSTYLYTGNGSSQTITNGIDLSTKGGLVWIKNRTTAGTNNVLTDTARGAGFRLFSDTTAAQANGSGTPSFTSTGFGLATASSNLNASSDNYASWTFRKQPKFFDVVTYTGNGVAGLRSFAHSLASVPGCIIIKDCTNTNPWIIYHRSITAGSNMEFTTGTTYANGYFATAPTSSVFSVDSTASTATTNVNGATYVAYLFAHNAGGFGLTGTDNVISCGSVVADAYVNLGYEPQWILTKDATDAGQEWVITDTMRGMNAIGSSTPIYLGLEPNSSRAEGNAGSYGAGAQINATGFQLNSSTVIPGSTYIYIAIRRGPMKVPTSGTSVFSPAYASTNTSPTKVTTGFPVDMQINSWLSGTGTNQPVLTRLQGVSTTTTESGVYLQTAATGAESPSPAYSLGWDNTGFRQFSYYDGVKSGFWNFGRAPGFFDVVCYTGTGSAQNVAHNLNAVPELWIIKDRTSTENWQVGSTLLANTEKLVLNTTAAKVTDTTAWNSTTPTAYVFTVGTQTAVNKGPGGFGPDNYVAYLFATVAGVSKVGSYTGTGATQTIDCGFTGGARFVLIKRTDSTGAWYVWDTARGIVSGNDPYLLLNSTAAEVTSTDYIDTYSAGFEISSTAPAAINASGGTFIFLAIA